MLLSRWSFIVAIIMALLAGRAGYATANCTYGPHEYKVVSTGMSPNHRFSIRAHGDGEMGYSNFHVYLFAEPAHKKIGPLEEVTDNLDTCADAIAAKWSRDGQHVVVSWRISHQENRVTLYRIANQRAYLVTLPSVINEATKRSHTTIKAFTGNSKNTKFIDFKWLTPTRFEVEEASSAWVSEPSRYQKLAGGFFDSDGKPDLDSGRVVEEFNGVATCKLATEDKCCVVSVRPGTL